MKHEYTDNDLQMALTLAAQSESGGIDISGIRGEEVWTDTEFFDLRAILDHLPDPVSDEWEECLFAEVEDHDESVRFEFDDGSIIQGKPHKRSRTDIELWTGYVITEVTLTAAKKGKATIYRLPAAVQHPDPAKHPVVIDSNGHAWFWSGTGNEYHSPDFPNTYKDRFTSWTPAKVVPAGDL